MARYTPEGLRDAAGEQSGRTGPARPPTRGIGLLGWLRWGWRQLTSMRVALILLLMLAVVALPGSFFPQRSQAPEAVAAYLEQHPDAGPLLDDLGFFEVYSSPWFSAVYLLLFISLIGCIVPRTWSHLQAMRAGPGRVPRSFARFPVRSTVALRSKPDAVVARAEAALGRGYKRRTSTADRDGVLRTEIAAERGYGRETGNLVFHLALVGLLVVTAWGQLVQYRGQAVVVAGSSMVNSAVDYDSFSSGAWFDSGSQEPFRIRLDSFRASFTETLRPDEFVASVTLSRPGEDESTAEISPNNPLAVGDANVYLTGNGYAPVFEVTDAAGDVAYSGPVLFLPQDVAYTSTGVIQVPDANGGQNQYGFNGQLFPTAAYAEDGTVVGSGFPLPGDPVVILTMWTGDLGLDDGSPANLLALDTSGLELATTTADDGTEVPVEIELRPGETVDLPDGQGTITFSELRRFAALDIRWDPSILWMGVFAGLAIAGLTASLFLPRRRLWLRIEAGERGSVVHAAALARGDDPGLQRELDRLVAALRRSGDVRGAGSGGPRPRQQRAREQRVESKDG